MDENIDFGRIAIVFEGDWDGNKSYSRLSAVRYSPDGCGYIALRDNRGVIPGTDLNTWGKMVDKGDKGDKGDEPQLSSETDLQGNMYILVDGERVKDLQGNPANFRGPKGDKGNPLTFNDLTPQQKAQLKGDTGNAAGFGTVSANIGSIGPGTPSVHVTTSGTDEHKNFTFIFDNLKGEPGGGEPYSEDTRNKVTSLSASSTDTQYPSAKCVYDMIGDIETILSSI